MAFMLYGPDGKPKNKPASDAIKHAGVSTWPELQAKRARERSPKMSDRSQYPGVADCGTGAGGFKPGNKCAKGRGMAEEIATAIANGEKPVIKAKHAAKMMVQMARRSDDVDITDVAVAGTLLFGGEGLGFAREAMPQLGENPEAFFAYIRDHFGITTERKDVKPLVIRPMQKEISGRRAGRFYNRIVKNGIAKAKRIVVTSDNYVLDGHHHWAAAVAHTLSNDRDAKTPASVLGTDHVTAMRLALDWMKLQNISPSTMRSAAENFASYIERRDDCGTGAGGFKKGNTCATGGVARNPILETKLHDYKWAEHPYFLGKKTADTPEPELNSDQWAAVREKGDEWTMAALAAVSEGTMSVEEFKSLGGSLSGDVSTIKALPPVAYHVTVAADAVASQGLKSSQERGVKGEGLGGGNPFGVSITDSTKVALGIYNGMLEAKDVLDGVITPQMILDEAERGINGVSWKDKVVKQLHSYGGDGYAENIVAGMHAGDLVNSFTPRLPSRPATREEHLEDVFRLYKYNSMYRESAGGQYDPFFAFNDLEAFAKLDRNQIKILRVTPASDEAKGEHVGGPEGEYRIFSGKAVKLEPWDGKESRALKPDCGTGAGGFKPGNTCAKGDGDGGEYVDIMEIVAGEKPTTRSEDGKTLTTTIPNAEVSRGIGGIENVDTTSAAIYLDAMQAQRRDGVIDTQKALSAKDFEYMVGQIVGQYDAATARGIEHNFYTPEEKLMQLEAYAEIQPLMRGGVTASGLDLGPPGPNGFSPNAEFLYTAAQAITSIRNTPAINMVMADKILTAYFTDPNSKGLGAGVKLSGPAGPEQLKSFAKLGKLIDAIGIDGARTLLSNPSVRAGDIVDSFEEAAPGVANFSAKGYSVNEMVPSFSAFGPKVGPFFSNNSGNHDALTADVWWSRTWGRLSGELVVQVNEDTSMAHAERLAKVSKTVTAEVLESLKTSRPDFVEAVKGVSSGKRSELVMAWAEAQAKQASRDGFPSFKNGTATKTRTELDAIARLMVKNVIHPIEAPEGAKMRSNMITVMREASKRTGVPVAYMQDTIWQDEQEIYKLLGVRTSTGIGVPVKYSDTIKAMVKNPKLRETGKKKRTSARSFAFRETRNIAEPDYLLGSIGEASQLLYDYELSEISDEQFVESMLKLQNILAGK